MTKEIKQQVHEFCEKHDLEPIVIAENGSRAWGYNDEESDYDVKVLFKHKDVEKYKSMWNHSESFTDSPDDLHEYAYWDIGKFMNLLWKANAQTYELMFAPIVYSDKNEDFDYLKDFVYEYCSNNLKRVAYHYYGLAYKTYQQRIRNVGEPTAKKYLYVIKPLLYLECIKQYNALPPLRFEDALCSAVESLSENQVEQLTTVLTAKKSGALNTINMQDFQELDKYCTESLDYWKNNLSDALDIPVGIVKKNLTDKEKFDIVYKKFVYGQDL